jgi:hypothetical protein
MNFSVPFAWGAPEQDERGAAPAVDANDRELVAIVKAASTLSRREKALILVLIQTISAWGGLEDTKRAS